MRLQRCPLCIFDYETSYDFEEHRKTPRHHFNYTLSTFPEARKKKIYDRRKVKVETSSIHPIETLRDGTIQTLVKPSTEGVTFLFKVSHTRSELVSLVEAFLLHPYPCFSIVDPLDVSSGETIIQLRQNVEYPVAVQFKNPGIGIYEMPIYFKFKYEQNKSRQKKTAQPEEKGPIVFDIIRIMVVNVMDMCSLEVVDPTVKSPFQCDIWPQEYMEAAVQGTRPDGRPIWECTDYKICNDLILFLNSDLKENKYMTPEQIEQLHYLINLLESPLTKDNYEEQFHFMLYLEEYDGIKHMQKYNMTNVSMRIIKLEHGEERVELEVPGLAEKRPSICKGDMVYTRICLEAQQPSNLIVDQLDHPFSGLVVQLYQSSIWISGFHPRLMYQLKMAPNMRFDIHFKFNRRPIALMHNAIDLTIREPLWNIVFPEKVPGGIPVRTIDLRNLRLENKLVAENPEQLRAVENIILGTSRPSPYIIFGPPGTGKTVAVVEAIIQVKKILSNSHILVCSSSNAACDHLAERLLPYCTTKEIIRLHSFSRDWKLVPEVLHKISNHESVEYYWPEPKDLQKFRIIVCTLCTAGRLVPLLEREYKFTHVFIDECGQAKEPEALIAIAGILEPPSRNLPAGGQLVLAGDPEQLGPICNSRNAEILLGVSLLERLMDTCPLYQMDEMGVYDCHFITKLILNFRSHPDILKLSNELFYEGKLIASCGEDVLNDPLRNIPLEWYKKGGASVRFHGVVGLEKREGRSPSFFNTHEINQVMKYVKSFLRPESGVQVLQSDIGIISPYIRQVYKLKAALSKMDCSDVEVGTTEAFQGREKRVIIITTVRSQKNFMEYDRKFQIGFLDNAKRFNVATTRACSLLLVIGNPHLLDQDENWKKLIDRCCSLESYVGCAHCPRDHQFEDYVLGKMANLAIEK